ncbi:hypothetical protein BDY19DRAFT_923813 [Irpex rosettiformis]|uniref:Uncharacterized protein n=1 Tax=Irpex rosettiformis TaxID=378272 RepID=A0ACB8UH10_9APHY|nr:hypothetical protein BDY19DRAFT_923813 [Irpex rosettiformis]
MHSLSAPSRWLASELATLLSTEPQQGKTAVQMNDTMDEDLFTARFDNVFMRHARGLVSGKEVDREELKRMLLVLQKRWNATDVRYGSCDLHRRIEGFHVSPFFMSGTLKGGSAANVLY